MSNAQKITLVAIVCLLATFTIHEDREGRGSGLATNYSAITGVDQSSTRFGWVPKVTRTTGAEPIANATGERARRYLDAIAEPERAAKRQSLRRNRRGLHPYARALETNQDKEDKEVDCECEDCECPPLVCKAGDCKKNYVAMFSAKWCGPCQAMYPILKEMRKAGYIVYFYDIEKFEDVDARFDIKFLPTFVVFDKGQEVIRNVGTVSKQWFLNNLKKRDDQEETTEPENPYDVITHD
jgi:thioredoxin 1